MFYLVFDTTQALIKDAQTQNFGGPSPTPTHFFITHFAQQLHNQNKNPQKLLVAVLLNQQQSLFVSFLFRFLLSIVQTESGHYKTASLHPSAWP